ncbi:hypothetical protein HGRIS_009344 [Hohenbuehelia grisea]|uniref:Cytochrome P450 n=1 Tax=Hohenbuehelia grisea TaxID=104357 RepID=A0ABR3J138_9AGAR
MNLPPLPSDVEMANYDLLASALVFGLIFTLYVRRWLERLGSRYDISLPPGPKKLPVLGNLLDMPKKFEWETYRKWALDLDSEIIHLDLAGTNVIVISSLEAATELLETRSSVYSSRARMPMINELMGWHFDFGFMPYGEYWRQCRRLFHQEFHPTAARRFQPKELKATHELLGKLLNDPEDLEGHLRHHAGTIVLGIAYGLQIQPKNDPYIRAAEEGVQPLLVAGVPGTFLVDALPILKHVPAWMPGAGFQIKAREWHKLADRMRLMPWDAAKKEIAEGINDSSFVSYCLEKVDQDGDIALQEKYIQSTAGTMYAGTACFELLLSLRFTDMTDLFSRLRYISALASFVLAMLENPDVVTKAQKELDNVVGQHRLPDFDDESSLPYISAIVKEVLRWRPVTPIAIPHVTTVDDVYRGYRIPANSIVIPNAWAMLYDENVYPSPYTFDPERFLKHGKLNRDVKDPTAAFGFGRRICPGRYMAQHTMWIAVASMLAVFDIKKAVDEDGNTIHPSHEYTSALVSTPLPFQYSLKPRSPEAEKLIRSAVA